MSSPPGPLHEYTRSTMNPAGIDVIEFPPTELSLEMTCVVTLIPRTLAWVITAPRFGVAA
jgi:hypothetical protein